MNSYNTVLVAFELAGNEGYLIEAARKVAATSADFLLMHVFEAPIYPADSLLGDIPLQVREQETAKVRLQFDELAKRHSLSKVDHKVAVGRPAREIHLAAQEIGADLIVVGSHGRHGIQLLLGSTANAILHGAKCDVLAVRIKEASSTT